MSGYGHRDECSIVGIGTTEFSKNADRTELTLGTEASVLALADAGLVAADIDGLICCSDDVVRPNALAEALGITNLTYAGSHGPGGTAPCSQVGQAVGAIVSGQATAVLLYRTLNGGSRRRYGMAPPGTDGGEVGGAGTFDEFFFPYGFFTAGHAYAMLARRHMIEFGTTHEQLGAIAVTTRKRANSNPDAMMYNKTMSMADYMDAPMISEPLRRFDCALDNDGACAVIITSSERARDLRQPPAVIRAVSFGSGGEPQPGILFPYLTRSTLTTTPSVHTAATLYERAGLGPADIDVAQFYDCFTITTLVQLEDYGFCAKGEGGPFAAAGEIDLGGSIPINTGGGHLSEGYINGMTHVLEGARQIRGTSTSQVAGAETCLVTSGPPAATGAVILTVAS